jgi:hypothetical protein
MSDARSKVESWVKGFTDNVRADTTQTEGLEDFSLSKKPRKKKTEDLSGVVETLTDALKEGGRKRSVKHWRRLACQHLGIKKMGAKRWEALVAYAMEHGMFHVEQHGSGSSTFDTLIPDAVEEPELVEEEVEHIATTMFGCPKDEEDDDDEGPPPPPEGPLGPKTFPCGHMGWGKEAEHEAARAEGKCCANWKSLPNWRTRGLTHAVPLNQRRSVEKQTGMGWPGLCCDPATGLYIGGNANDCRYYHTGPERCAVHGGGSTSRGSGKD